MYVCEVLSIYHVYYVQGPGELPPPPHILKPEYAFDKTPFETILKMMQLCIPIPTVCPKNSYPFYKVSYCIKWVTTSWPLVTEDFKPLELQSAKICRCQAKYHYIYCAAPPLKKR